MSWESIFGQLGWDSLVFRRHQAPLRQRVRGVRRGQYCGAGGDRRCGSAHCDALVGGPLWRDWLTSVDHKKIGIMYIVIALVMFLRALIEAGVMRSQQLAAYDSAGYL